MLVSLYFGFPDTVHRQLHFITVCVTKFLTLLHYYYLYNDNVYSIVVHVKSGKL
jgi:hypothetical protein